MPLHQKVGEIFLEDEGGRAAFSNSLRRDFLVKDAGIFAPRTNTVRNELRVVLLLESPHTDEVEPSDIHDRHPLAGRSGKDVTKVLMEWLPGSNHQDNESIGSLVNRKHCDVRWLGIMNVSQLPFQKEPYKRQDNGIRQHTCWSDYITCMKYIKKHLDVKTYKGKDDAETQNLRRLQCKIEELENAIIEDLRRRLDSIKSARPDVLLVCCGEVARKFYEKTSICMYNTDAPHPSRSHWIHYLKLKKLKPEITRRIQQT